MRHIDCLQIARHGFEQIGQHFFVPKPNRIVLLNVPPSNASHRLNCFLLCHVVQIFPQKSVAKLIIRSINVIRRCDNQIQSLFVCQRFHDFHVSDIRLVHKHANAEQQQDFHLVVDFQHHNTANILFFDVRDKSVLHCMVM